jgi:hypothetical protein
VKTGKKKRKTHLSQASLPTWLLKKFPLSSTVKFLDAMIIMNKKLHHHNILSEEH